MTWGRGGNAIYCTAPCTVTAEKVTLTPNGKNGQNATFYDANNEQVGYFPDVAGLEKGA